MKRMVRSFLSTLFYLFSFFRKREGVIVLMYHRVNDSLPANDLVVPVEVFRRQMRYLKEHCEVIDTKELIQGFNVSTFQGIKGAPKTKKPAVVITFDDGYRDNYLNAYPILKELGLPATIFLITGMIGTDKKRPRYDKMPSPDMMNWQEVDEMVNHGISFGPHTKSHPHLSQLSYAEQRKEIEDSVNDLGRRVTSKIFCYPYGDYNRDTLKILRELGIKIAFTVKPGINNDKIDSLELRRTEISGLDSIFDFRKKLAGAFDIIHSFCQLKLK